MSPRIVRVLVILAAPVAIAILPLPSEWGGGRDLDPVATDLLGVSATREDLCEVLDMFRRGPVPVTNRGWYVRAEVVRASADYCDG